jgi:outer membrane protein TolC
MSILRIIRTCLPAAALAALLGCVDQDKEVAQYRAVLDARGASSATTRLAATAPATQPGAALTLHEAMALANAHNERLAMGGEDYLQALIDKDRAVAAFLPMISLQPSYFQTQTVPLPPGAGTFFPLHALDDPINASMNVFNGFRDVAALKRSAANADQRKALLLDLQSTLLVEVAQVYYQVLRSERNSEVLINSVKVQTDRVDDLQRKLHAGVVRPVDVSQAQAQVAATRVSLIGAQSEIVRGRATLALLIGVPQVAAALVDAFDVPAVPPLEVLQPRAAGNREDLAAAIAGVGAARQGVESAVGQYYPSLSVNFNRFLSRQSFPTDSDWNLVLAANLPIFSGGEIHASVRAAWSQLRQAKLNESFIRRQIVEQVRIAYEDLSAARQTVEQLQAQLAAARDGYNQAVQSSKAGTGTNLEVLISQDQLLLAQLRLVSQQFDYKVAYLSLLRTAGELWLDSPAVAGATPSTMPTTMPASGPGGLEGTCAVP